MLRCTRRKLAARTRQAYKPDYLYLFRPEPKRQACAAFLISSARAEGDLQRQSSSLDALGDTGLCYKVVVCTRKEAPCAPSGLAVLHGGQVGSDWETARAFAT